MLICPPSGIFGRSARRAGEGEDMRKAQIIREVRQLVALEGQPDGRGSVYMGGDALDAISRLLDRADRPAWKRIRGGAK